MAKLSKRERSITIITWGRGAHHKKGYPPVKTERNFNAAIISDRPYNIDIRKINGRNGALQDAFYSNREFQDFIDSIVNQIEMLDLHVVSINCSKGRHRSVAAAELLKRLFYPRADVHHWDL